MIAERKLLLSSICIKRKYWIRENFWHPVFDRFLCFEMSWTWFDHFWEISVCLCISKILWTLFSKELMRGNYEILYSVAPCYNLGLIRFWRISSKKFWCCPIFFISLTEWCSIKMRGIVSNMKYFKPIISKFKEFIYNSNSKIIYNFWMYGAILPL